MYFKIHTNLPNTFQMYSQKSINVLKLNIKILISFHLDTVIQKNNSHINIQFHGFHWGLLICNFCLLEEAFFGATFPLWLVCGVLVGCRDWLVWVLWGVWICCGGWVVRVCWGVWVCCGGWVVWFCCVG